MKLEKCKICNNNFSQESGHFTIHLKNDHNIDLEEYIVITEYNGIHPKCLCGLCDENSKFNIRTRKFYKINNNHKKFDWIKEQWIIKYGIPKCKCGNDVGWFRGKPNKYCCYKCLPNRWNQNKVKKTIKEKYGVDHISKVVNVTKKREETLKPLRKNMAIKCNETKIKKYENGAFNPDKFKKTMIKKYSVEHPSQIQKNRKNSSNRMIKNNPLFNEENVDKMMETRMRKLENGEIKFFNTKKYNDDLYYQGSYEKHFLDLCSEIGIIKDIKNGHSFKYLDKHNGCRTITDFSYNDIEIEIKSKWILEKQGGYEKINAKRISVENENKKYILILDKNYTEFLKLIIKKQ